MGVAVELAGGVPQVQCHALSGEERLGQPTRLELLVTSAEAIEPGAVLGRAAAVTLVSRYGERRIMGVVTRFTAIATARTNPRRSYRITLCSGLALLELRRRSRVYQHLTVPAIVQKLLVEGGYPQDRIKLALSEPHAVRDYVIQYAETDATFLRRLCEEDGLYYRFPSQPGDDAETIEISDCSAGAASALAGPLTLVDDAGLLGSGPAATGWRTIRRRRPGKVTLRDYDHEHPAVDLEATSKDGTEIEQGSEVYEAPGRFKDPGGGTARARWRLESLRAGALQSTFESTALALAPGLSFAVEVGADHLGAPPSGDEHVVVAVKHAFRADEDRHRLEIEAIPRKVPFRLPRITPRPRIHGVQSAIVTGASGAEIHPDALGRIFVRFHWDLDGPRDHGSSLPVRTLQPNTSGSMILPRIGWEVFVLFEDGDPDRPYIVGRSYNGKQPPPYKLPANKTMTVLATDSSPGGAGRNLISFDDGAGRQHINIQATFGRDTTVGSKMVIQTVKNERYSTTGDQTRSVGASEHISVTEAYFDTVGSQSGLVGGLHKVTTGGDMGIGVGSETVVIGAALLEQIGNPVKGALNLAASVALHELGSKGKAGMVASMALGIAKSAAEGYAQDKGGGWDGAEKAAKTAAAGTLMGFLPGGDAIMAGAAGSKSLNPWDPDQPDAGGEQAGGGAGGGDSDASAPAGPGPGHRTLGVKGNAFIGIGGSSSINSPGSITWSTLGTSVHATGGSRSIKAASVGYRVAGVSGESIGGGSTITASGKIGRGSAVLASMSVGGALSVNGASYGIKAPKVTIKVGGALTMTGAHVTFSCPGATIAASPGGLLLQAASIEIDGLWAQSGGMSHK
jgi:type VI secretion system secreted protein VgrG